jgi:hypothetical protein
MAAGGVVASGNILSSAALVFGGSVSCTGGSGAGTATAPYSGALECLLPYGSSIEATFSHYAVQPLDFSLPGHELFGSTTLEWSNTCVAGSGDCTNETRLASADAFAQVQEAPTSTFLGFVKPLAQGSKARGPGRVTFRLGDAAGILLRDAAAAELAASCGVTVQLAGSAQECATYEAGHDRFKANVTSPSTRAAARYALTIAVHGTPVHIEPVATPSN